MSSLRRLRGGGGCGTHTVVRLDNSDVKAGVFKKKRQKDGIYYVSKIFSFFKKNLYKRNKFAVDVTTVWLNDDVAADGYFLMTIAWIHSAVESGTSTSAAKYLRKDAAGEQLDVTLVK